MRIYIICNILSFDTFTRDYDCDLLTCISFFFSGEGGGGGETFDSNDSASPLTLTKQI